MKVIRIIATFLLIVFLINFVVPVSLAIYSNENKENTEVNKAIEKTEDNVIEQNKEQERENTQANEIKEDNKLNQENSNAVNKSIQEDNDISSSAEEMENDSKNEEEAIETITNNIQEEKPKHTIKDGRYKIKANIGSDMYLDISAGSTDNGANLQIWEKLDVKQQQFDVQDIGDGYYTITAVHSNKLLDVCNAGKENETNVSQHESNNSDAQKWIIKEIGENKYNIISKCNGLYLDIAGGWTDNGTNVQMYEPISKSSQEFSFECVEHTIKDGRYKIKANIGSDMYLDISAGSTDNGANLQIWEKLDVKQQQFDVQDIGNGYYTITAVHSKKLLDVCNAGKENETNVSQHESNNSDAQKWIIKEIGENKYNIISKCNGLYLDVAGGWTDNGTNVQMYEPISKASQEFIFEKVEEGNTTNPPIEPEVTPSDDLKEGLYKIKAGVGSNMYLDISGGSINDGANLQIYENLQVRQQKFKVTKVGDYYKIECFKSKKLLDVYQAGKTNGTNVGQCTDNGNDAQQWIIKKSEKGNYNIISKCNGLYLDVSGANTANSTNVQVYERTGNDAQEFIFEEQEMITPEHTIDDGVYQIKSSMNKNMLVDISGESVSNSANVQIWQNIDLKNQKFHVKDIGNGYYTIKAVHSKKMLDVFEGSKESEANVQQYENNGSTAQQWILHKVKNSDNEYNIISRCNDLYLDIYQGNMANGTNIQMYEGNGSAAQKFTFEKTEYQEIDDGMYEIHLAMNTEKLIQVPDGNTENEAPAQVWSQYDANNQKVNVTYNKSDKNYTIKFVNSGKLLDVREEGKVDGTKVQQYQWTGSEAQRWKIIDLADGTYNIVSECGGLYLDIYQGNTSNGTQVQMYHADGSDAQRFKFVKTSKALFETYGYETLDGNRYPGYKEGLNALQRQHPNWNIRVVYTGLDWNSVLTAEEQGTRSLTQAEGAWRKSDVGYDVSKGWYLATRPAIAYMMDPRNSLDDGYVFQFQNLSSSSGSYDQIQRIVSGYSYLNNASCINAILEAAQENGISPFHIASRIIQECGTGGGSMYGYTYNGRKVYNLYNINVSGNDASGLVRGAQYAYDRGWFTPEDSIKGGANFLKTNYISKGQSTLYFQKYNVIDKSNLYNHQYMQNIRAANDEGKRISDSYKKNGLIDSSFSFVIPIYEGMPVSKCPRP